MKISLELKAAKFICLGSFLSVPKSLYILYINNYFIRLPKDVDINREWTNAINQINDESHKCKGSGLICGLHFDVKNIKNKYGKVQLEKGAVPVYFESVNSQSTANVNVPDSMQNTIDVDVLNSEIHELKRMLFKEKLDRDIEFRKKDDRIDALTKKCNDLTIKTKSLEKSCSILDRQGNEMRDRLLKYTGAADINVNFCIIFIFM